MLHSAPQVWSVAALLLATADALAARFGSVTVRGELVGMSRGTSGHCYFTLKDAASPGAALRCVMFRRAVTLLPFAPADGQQVEVRGRLAIYEARGDLQFIAESMQRVGSGSLYEEFLRRRDRLAQLGLFDEQRKRALPRFPRTIGVVTSAAGAAVHDVVTTLQRRAPQVQVVLYPTLVQGSDAPRAIVAALETAARRNEVELLILCRGGGSLEDLWAFNDEQVVRAIAESPLPVVCGVGHETDVTLVDLAADLRAPTPTAAAELAAPAAAQLIAQLNALQQRLVRRVQQRLEAAAQRLDRVSLRWSRPAQVLARHAHRLDVLCQRQRAAAATALQQRQQGSLRLHDALRRSAPALLEQRRTRLEHVALRLAALDPGRVLERGYVWAATKSGRPITSAQQVQVGQELLLQWADGQAAATVSSAPDSQRKAPD